MDTIGFLRHFIRSEHRVRTYNRHKKRSVNTRRSNKNQQAKWQNKSMNHQVVIKIYAVEPLCVKRQLAAVVSHSRCVRVFVFFFFYLLLLQWHRMCATIITNVRISIRGDQACVQNVYTKYFFWPLLWVHHIMRLFFGPIQANKWASEREKTVYSSSPSIRHWPGHSIRLHHLIRNQADRWWFDQHTIYTIKSRQEKC